MGTDGNSSPPYTRRAHAGGTYGESVPKRSRFVEQLAVDSKNVLIKWKTPGLIVGSVRDPDGGIFDVQRDPSRGWSCSCAGLGCVHVAAVRDVTDEAMS
jgi:hypothetical protein